MIKNCGIIVLLSLMLGCQYSNISSSGIDTKDKSIAVIEEWMIIEKIEESNGIVEISNKERTARFKKNSIIKIVSAYESENGYESISIFTGGEHSIWATKNMDIRLQVLNLLHM